MPIRSNALVWESAPRSFAIKSSENILRCPAEIAPKRVSEPKLVATLARSAFVPYAGSVLSGPVVCPDAERSIVRSLLRDLPLVTFLSSDWSSFMKWLTKMTTVQVATVVGQANPNFDADLEKFSEGLVKFNPHWQSIALNEATRQRALHQAQPTAPLCVIGEDRPGKLVRIEPKSQALRFMAKKWNQVLARESDIKTKTLLADSGWGAGSVIVEPEGDRKFACCEFDISGRELHLTAPAIWMQRIDEWVESLCGFSGTSIPHVTVSTPYLVIAGYLIETLQADRTVEVSTPDLVWGWHPLLTMLEFLGQTHKPSMLINLHHGSGLQIALVW